MSGEGECWVAPIVCPSCGRTNDCHAKPGAARPSQGDMGICWGCREPYVFELSGRRFLPGEWSDEHEVAYRQVLGVMLESRTPGEATSLRSAIEPNGGRGGER